MYLKVKLSHLLLLTVVTIALTALIVSPKTIEASPKPTVVDDILVVWVDETTGLLNSTIVTPAQAPDTQTNLNKKQKVQNWINNGGDGSWTQVGVKMYFATTGYVSPN